MSGIYQAERRLRELFDDQGLVVVDWRMTGKSHLVIRLRAPNGVEQPFTFCREHGDRHAAKNSEARVKRFARDNPAPQPTLMAERLKSLITPQRAVHVVIDEPTTPPIPTQPESTAMTTATTTATEKPDDAKYNRFTQDNYFDLCVHLKENVAEGREVTLVNLAKECATALGVDHLAVDTLKRALEKVGRKLHEPKRGPYTTRSDIVSSELVRLMRSLGFEPAPELIALVERKAK